MGPRLAVDSVLGVDGWTIELGVKLEHRFSPSGASAGRASVNGSLVLRSGMKRVLGTWKLQGASASAGPDVLQVAFIHAARVTEPQEVYFLGMALIASDSPSAVVSWYELTLPSGVKPTTKPGPSKGTSARLTTASRS